MSTSPPPAPPHHSSYHSFYTSRLHIRTPLPSDAQAIQTLRSSPADNPHTPNEPDSSPDIFIQRMKEKWIPASQRGESAFMVVCLQSSNSSASTNPNPNPAIDENATSEKLIGFGGFNSFPFVTDSDGKQALVGDTGLQISHKHWRKGYGEEAFIGTVDYGFRELGCGMISVDTDPGNEAWTGMMRKMGLGDFETTEVAQGGPQKGMVCLFWKFGRRDWEERKGRG